MLQSSPHHVRVPRLARTRAKVALILTSVCALVAAVLIPLTSHLNAQAATQFPEPSRPSRLDPGLGHVDPPQAVCRSFTLTPPKPPESAPC